MTIRTRRERAASFPMTVAVGAAKNPSSPNEEDESVMSSESEKLSEDVVVEVEDGSEASVSDGLGGSRTSVCHV